MANWCTREHHLHAARAYIAQARHFRLRGSPFAVTLLMWAGNARRRAMAYSEPPAAQGDLFGGAS